MIVLSKGIDDQQRIVISMKHRSLLFISLLFNAVFLTLLVTMAITYRDKILQRFVGWKGEAKIVMFGNSITSQGNWVELLGRTDVVNSGLPGLCTYHFIELLQSQVIDLKPEICFVKAGINDITVGVSAEKIQSNYQLILERIKENNITPIVTLTLYEQNDPASKKEVKQLNEFLIDYCNTHKIEYLDLNALISDSTGLKPEYAVDKTHLNNKAYKIWAEEVRKILKRKRI